MNSFLPILKKELRTYFNSPIAYIVVVFFLVFTSVWFFYVNHFAAADTASLRVYFSIIPIIFIFLLPSLTMRSWAEERRMKTDELLLTFPLSEGNIVFGKFFAAFLLLVFTLLLTLFVPLSIAPLGNFETGQIIGQYFGTLLLGAAGIAAGLFISSLTKNQISAFLFSGVFLLFITLIGQLSSFSALPGWIKSLAQYLSLSYHFESFSKGLLDTRDLVYFLVLTSLFLFLNTRVIKERREN